MRDSIHRQPIVWRALLTILLVWPAASVDALVVGSSATAPALTNVNPKDYVPLAGQPDWNGGDPGWDSVTTSGLLGVYLGDGWVLTARHNGTPNTVTFETQTGTMSYQPKPGETYIIPNPPPLLAGGYDLSNLEFGESDLRLYRINGTPDVPARAIASRSDPLPAGAEILSVSRGARVRQSAETTWYYTGGSNGGSWSEVPGGHQAVYKGFKTQNTNTERFWGTNELVSPTTSLISSVFESSLPLNSDTTGITHMTTNDGKTRNMIVMPVLFDHPSNGGTPWETQGMPGVGPLPGDSGSPVFYNYAEEGEPPNWKLAGIMNFVRYYGNQPDSSAIYGQTNGSTVIANTGNASFFADLSYYNQAYSQSICDHMRSCGNYSIMGDVNIDENVDAADITAFINGWRKDSGFSTGDYVTWKQGDLNLDGKTDVADFFLLRQALGATGNGTALADAMAASLFGIAVPEPASAILVLLAVGSCCATTRRRRLSPRA
ncbi:MAG: dockerin type I domain-containing protein [Pirellulales bacterium]